MLKNRIIATLIVKNDIVVQSIGFNKYLPVGKPKIAVEALNDWGVDEIMIIDIDASKESRTISPLMINDVSKFAQVPICAGGGISTPEDIKKLLDNGADKVCINQSFLKRPVFIKESTNKFGSQCIVVSIDIKKIKSDYFVYDHVKKECAQNIEEAIKKAEHFEAGEILINSVDNDGKKCGYDLDLIGKACALTDLPVIAIGGAKNAQDMIKVIKTQKVSAMAAANMFHFAEHNVILTKGFLKKDVNYPIRLESHANYKESDFDNDVRLLKKDDEILDLLSFETFEKEII